MQAKSWRIRISVIGNVGRSVVLFVDDYCESRHSQCHFIRDAIDRISLACKRLSANVKPDTVFFQRADQEVPW